MLKELDKLFISQTEEKNKALLLIILSEVKLRRILKDGRDNSNNKTEKISE